MFETVAARIPAGDAPFTTDRVALARMDEPAGSGGAPSREGVAASRDVELAREARLASFLRAWWIDERPDWTGAEWWDAPLRDEVRGLLWLPAGPVLVSSLAEIPAGGACTDPHAGESPPGWPTPGHARGWPCSCKVVLAAAWEACAAWVAAGSARALVEAAGPAEVTFAPPQPAPQISDPAREELALALRTSPASMGNRIAAARELCTHSDLLALVESAAISSWGARLVVLELAGLPDDLARTVAAEVAERVRERLASGRRPWTSAEIGRTARRVRLRRAPEHEQGLRACALADRKVQVFADRNGMAVLHALIESTEAHRIHRRLSAIAEGMDDPERTRDQVRADTLVDLVLGGAGSWGGMRGSAPAAGHGAKPAGPNPTAPNPTAPNPTAPNPTAPNTAVANPAAPHQEAGPRGVRPEINVVVSLVTLLGLVDDPAHVPGVGAIGADVARALAAEGAWRAWVTDATTGRVVATGSRSYVPTEAVARLVRAREPYCRMPGCRRAAERCDLDHAIPWPAGPTSASNLGPLCRRHHVLKTHAGWALQPTAPPTELPATADPPNWPDPPNSTDPIDPPDPPNSTDPIDPPDPPDPTDPIDQPDPADQPDGTRGLSPAPGTVSRGWTWRTPAGFTVSDEERPPLE